MNACRYSFLVPMMGIILMTITGNISASEKVTEEAKKFVEEYTQKIKPLEIASGRAWWNANMTGKEEHFEKKEEAENKINAVLSDKEAFQKVKKLKASGEIDDPIVQRAIEVIYLSYLGKQVEPELLKKITALANSIERKWSTFRAKVDGKELTDGEIRRILRTSKLSEKRKEAYLASKDVGNVVEKELLELVKLRNQAAKELGFANYHVMQLELNEQNGKDLIKLFDELDELTREPFRKAKVEMDIELSAMYNVKLENLMPWHYHDPFFQEVPSVFATDLDKIYQNADFVKLCRDFYKGIGLPIDLVIKKSGGDFLPKKGKNPHAFCIDITRDGTDVRVLANIEPNERWMSTMLHEFGHAVYSSINIPEKLPYVLRQDSHILTTEGIAMMFEKLSKRRAWLEKMGVKITNPKEFDETAEKMNRFKLLIFSRWCQVMLRFEKSMYENPDQDLNKLWWDLVEKYQRLKRPENRSAPDYASKIHIISAPVYYHNYMMGELFASQLHEAIAREVYEGADPKTVVYVGNTKVGDFLQQKIFNPGRSLSWNELTRFATGMELSAQAFARELGAK